MEPINYSVIIRTTGTAGEKYQALLTSIAKLEPRPEEVIVVLPEGYAKPKEALGWETYYFCPKGMVLQRSTGIAKCRTPYALICDDDIRFDPDLVQKLYEPIRLGLCGLSAGPLYSNLPAKGLGGLSSVISGAAAPTVFHRDRFISVLRTTGYSYNRHLDSEKKRYYAAQSMPWACFFADMEALRRIDFDAETWVDANGYSAYDDQTMFYKAWLRGIKTIVVADACYTHLDAKTSWHDNKSLYCSMLNRIIFWHRFIYSTETTLGGRLLARAAFGYRMLWLRLNSLVYRFTGKYSREEFSTVRKAWQDGKSFLKSDDYRSLPPVRDPSPDT